MSEKSKGLGSVTRDAACSPLRAVRLLCEGNIQEGSAVAWLIDSTLSNADVVRDPEERCLALYRPLVQACEGPFFLWPPSPSARTAEGPTTARLLESPSFFRSFLCAALRMAAMANTALLLPVTESAAQLHAIRRIQSGAAQALYERGEDFDQALSLGVCPTTQSALQNARALLEDADLLLIDTDAISRTVTGVTPISRLIEDAVESARALNRFVLFKGEPANDPRALSHLAAMGVHAVVDPFCNPVERINKIHAKTSCK